MALLIIVAGIIAALLLFRWARTLALFALAALVVWWMATAPRTHAQEPMVECHLGLTSQVVPDYACAVLREGFAKLRIGGDSQRMRDGEWDCAVAITHRVRGNVQPTGNPGFGPPMEFLPMCNQMQTREMYARAAQGR